MALQIQRQALVILPQSQWDRLIQRGQVLIQRDAVCIAYPDQATPAELARIVEAAQGKKPDA